jgi:hypothetical protein
MRTVVALFTVAIAVALVGIVFAGSTSADQVVGPLSGTVSSSSTAGSVDQGSTAMLVKDKHHKHHDGHHRRHWGHHRDWSGYPDYSWDSDSSSIDAKTCVWNGYSYTCYEPSYRY